MSKSIRKRFLIYILPAQLATLLILGLAGYLFSSKIVTSQAKANFQKTINVVFGEIENELIERLDKIKVFFRSPSLIKFVSAPYYKSSLDIDAYNFQRGNGLVFTDPEIGDLVNFPVGFLANEGNKKVEDMGLFPSIEFVNSEGYVVQHIYVGGSNDADFEIPNNPKLKRQNEKWFKEAMKGEIYISKPRKEKLYLKEYNPVEISLEEKTVEEELVIIALPYKIGDKVVGVLKVTTMPDFLSMAAPENSKKTLLMLVDSTGDVITKYGSTSSIKTFPKTEIEKILNERSGKIVDNGAQLIMSKRIPEAGWSLIIAKDKRDIYASVFNLRNRMVVIILISIIMMAILVAFIIRKLLMPIINLRNASERIAGGELGLTVPTEGEDEIAALTKSFNTMSTRVKNMHAELEKSNIKLANIGYARKQMLKMIGHELRTPITGIIGFYELIDEQIKGGEIKYDTDVEEVKDLLGHMGDSIKEFEVLIRRLTKASALVSQDPTLEKESFAPSDLKSIIRVVSMKIDKQLKDRNLVLKVDVPDNCIINCPSEMLELLFDEALSNAIKYSEDEGAIEIKGKIKEDVVEFDIKDNGCGIPQNYIDEVVEPFFEVADAIHHSTGRYKAQGGGLGLGFTLIINIIKRYGGVLEIESKEDQGTILHITLPLASE